MNVIALYPVKFSPLLQFHQPFQYPKKNMQLQRMFDWKLTFYSVNLPFISPWAIYNPSKHPHSTCFYPFPSSSWK